MYAPLVASKKTDRHILMDVTIDAVITLDHTDTLSIEIVKGTTAT